MVAKVAFIIVCWNNKPLLEECLNAIYNQTYPNKEIYLIDNNSSDGSAEYVERYFPSVHLFKSLKNNGFARGNNILINDAMKDESIKYIALVNTDAILDENWTKELVEAAEKYHNVAGLQGITIDYFNRHLVDSHHIYVAENFQSTQYGYKSMYFANSYYDEKVMGVNAAAALYTRKFIETQPFNTLFDERFFMYLEDVDVSLRALLLGFNNYFVANAKAFHMGSVSSNKRSSDFSLYYTARNQAALLIKNFPLKILLAYSVKWLKFELHFVKYLKTQYGKKTRNTYLRGRLVGFLVTWRYFGSRLRLIRRRRISNSEISSYMRNKGRKVV